MFEFHELLNRVYLKKFGHIANSHVQTNMFIAVAIVERNPYLASQAHILQHINGNFIF